MSDHDFPPGWTEERIQRILAHYESQTEEEAAFEDESTFAGDLAVVQVPAELVPVIREIIALYEAATVS